MIVLIMIVIECMGFSYFIFFFWAGQKVGYREKFLFVSLGKGVFVREFSFSFSFSFLLRLREKFGSAIVYVNTYIALDMSIEYTFLH